MTYSPVIFRYVYYNATDTSAIGNSSEAFHHLSTTALNTNSSSHLTTSGQIELNIGLASNRIYNVLYENVAYCMVAFLVPLMTLVVFNVRLVVQLRRSRRMRRTLRPVQFSRRFSAAGGEGPAPPWRGRTAGAGAGRDAGVCSGSGQDEINITLVMVVIVVVFIVCELPASANQVCSNCSERVGSFF